MPCSLNRPFAHLGTGALAGSIPREGRMSVPNIAMYAGNTLGPSKIAQNRKPARQAGWTTIILGLFHIGYPPRYAEAEIFFNDTSIIKGGSDAGKFNTGFDPAWPGEIARLKQNSRITKIYASIGGGGDVVDFGTIKNIFEDNNNSFSRTPLETNLQLIKDTFDAVDGIDMDCEDIYDQPSFTAFCEMVAGMGFGITFCPYDELQMTFWARSLKALEAGKKTKGAVKWWNLQCYDGGSGNDPKTWAKAIARQMPKFTTDGFILAGDWNRFYDSDPDWLKWRGHCPSDVKRQLSGFSKLGGGFLWSMDSILEEGPKIEGCGRVVGMTDYAAAIREATQAIAPSR